MRSKAKMVNYGIVYGLSAFGLSDRLQIEKEEAEEFIERYLERFPRCRAFIEETIERAREEGHVTRSSAASGASPSFARASSRRARSGSGSR